MHRHLLIASIASAGTWLLGRLALDWIACTSDSLALLGWR